MLPQDPEQKPLSCPFCGESEETIDFDYCDHCCEMICLDCFNSEDHLCLQDEDV